MMRKEKVGYFMIFSQIMNTHTKYSPAPRTLHNRLRKRFLLSPSRHNP